MHTCYKEKHRSFFSCSKETELELNADKIKYMAMSRDQIVGKCQHIKTANSSFERVE